MDDISFRHEDYAKMIFALLDSLKLYKVNAIGASSGGTTLHFLNVMQPDRFKSVVTVGGHIYYSKQAREWIAKAGIKNFMEWAQYHGPEKQVSGKGIPGEWKNLWRGIFYTRYFEYHQGKMVSGIRRQ